MFNIGDSRVYGLDDDGATQLTIDHRSMADPRAITRFLGGAHSQSIPDTTEPALTDWKGFLICTDGFYGHLTKVDLQLVRKVDPAVAIETLMDLALERGSSDNLTAVYVISS